ncbi:MAG: Bacterial pre-peptidase C-terminal domain, partial [Acidobacteriota bacterium]
LKGTQPTCAQHTASGGIQSLMGCPPNTIVRGDMVYYRVKVGERGKKLTISVNGRNSLYGEDVDLYVRRDAQPTPTMVIDEYASITDCAGGCKSATKGVNEYIEINNPEVGDWHILVNGHTFLKSTYTLTVTLK